MNKYEESLQNFTEIELTMNTWTENCYVLKVLVEKATPKKPKNWNAEKRINEKVEYNCPICNRLYVERVNYCSNCGQKLKWRTKEEEEQFKNEEIE